mmetsp:Transcript_30540/g.93347  ORF Transcript_30540/g.93347 Transcript_30540/m.93347 type:complete len:96 (+) Transcript_30540:86-373(+)
MRRALAALVSALVVGCAAGFFALPPHVVGKTTRRSARRPAPLRAAPDEDKAAENVPPPQPEYDVENPFSDLQSPVTLTVLGFGLIAFNFFVVANL